MLKRVNNQDIIPNAQVKISDALFPCPFKSGLEFSTPARGKWNIVHTGMLIPESHQVFVCAQGCLRGVILTAAEMNEMERMSWVSLQETDMFDGTIDQNIVNGTANILNQLDKLPRAVLVFISCMHLFAGCDFVGALEDLRHMYPSVDFIDCYMHPTMRKNGLNPDQTMRRQLYSALKPTDNKDRYVNIIGNDYATDNESELISIIKKAGFGIREITSCKNYDEYLDMSKSMFNVTYTHDAEPSGKYLSKRLSQTHISIPISYSFDEIEYGYKRLCDALSADVCDFSQEKRTALDELKAASEIIGKTKIEIDYTAVPRPLSLARLLVENGFNVTKIYSEAFLTEEKEDFEWLRANVPDMIISSTTEVQMRLANNSESGNDVLAIGQKAAFFSGTEHFVNIISAGGMYGFSGISKLAKLMTEAFNEKKDTRNLIVKKGLGCECCL